MGGCLVPRSDNTTSGRRQGSERRRGVFFPEINIERISERKGTARVRLSEMRNAIGLVVAGLIAVGCAVDEAEEQGELGTASQDLVRCPNPDNCTVSNGGGVYTEENGFAGIGASQTMITTFVNNYSNGQPVGVTLLARGWNANTQMWVAQTPIISFAMVNGGANGERYRVLEVKETNTRVVFTLAPTVHAGPNVKFSPTPTADIEIVLYGNPAFTLSIRATGGSDSGLIFYDAVWNPNVGYDATHATQYCFRSNANSTAPDYNQPDLEVFEQGLYVDPTTGVTTQAPNETTFSCFRGAIAQAHGWGYIYNGTYDQLTTFEAAMQMKRASYCGDEAFYTKRGVQIVIGDTAGINGTNSTLTKVSVEAMWGRGAGGHVRALCWNSGNVRLPGALYPNNAPGGQPFAGVCDIGQGPFTIPDCATGSYNGTLIETFDRKAP
ncbi:MAG: ADYC domain-containing protein [Kofleriaceae bacterium]